MVGFKFFLVSVVKGQEENTIQWEKGTSGDPVENALWKELGELHNPNENTLQIKGGH